MKKNSIGEELFNKIRGRFSQVSLSDSDGNAVSDPSAAKFFVFEYTANGMKIGKVSVDVDDKVLTVIYSRDLFDGALSSFKHDWYNFLKEMRFFAKKRARQFVVRDIDKTNSEPRSGEDKMNESKMYGTARTSYQKVDNARLIIKHTGPINAESSSARSQHIGSIYIESAEGERFKYPYKHLSGARAMARHVSEGGKQYDDFGSHIVSLSEEIYKLRKFKSHMNRSNVMAESLSQYMDVVNSRLAEVKKTVDRLQKSQYYREAIDNFEKPVLEEVPAEVADSWIDQLTIKQFNEELKDVFPYIYRLVGEAKRAETVTLEDVVDEADPCWKGYRQIGMKEKKGKKVPNCVPEEIELEQAFESMLGQFAEAETKKKINDLSPEQSGWPFVKFAEKTLPNGKKSLQALVNPAAWSGSAFSRGSADTLVFNLVPPGANADGKIYHSLNQMMDKLNKVNNTDGIMVQMNSFLNRISDEKRYPQYQYLFNWLQQLTDRQLKVVPDESEKETTKKPPIIFVSVEVTTKSGKEVHRVLGETLRVLEFLLNVNDKTFDGNPFVQGTPVEFEMGPMRGWQGIVISSTMPPKEEKPKYYANQKFKDLRAKIEQPYEKILVTNKDAFFKIRKDYYNQIFSKYFKPTRGVFEVPPGDLEAFKSIVYSNKFENEVGSPGLYFLSMVESPDKIPDAVVEDLPKWMQELVQGQYDKVKYTDDNQKPKDTELSPDADKWTAIDKSKLTGPLSTNSFTTIINKLGEKYLTKNLTIQRDEFKQMEDLDDPALKTHMKQLIKTEDAQTARDIAAKIIMKQNVFPIEKKERMDMVIHIVSQNNKDTVIDIMKKWYFENIQLKASQTFTSIAPTPGMPPTEPKPEKEKTLKKGDPITKEELSHLADLVNDRNTILPYVKQQAIELLKSKSLMTPETFREFENRINRDAKTKWMVFNFISDLVLKWEGLGVINRVHILNTPMKREPPPNPYIHKTYQKENIEEAKDYNFSADDIARLSQIQDLNTAKQEALKLITSKSKRPMTSDKIGYFTNAIQSKKNVDALVKMMYDMMLSGEGHGVIGTRTSMNPSKYRQTYGEEITNELKKENKKSKKLPLTDFVESYFDKKTGKFPKGETAVLTMVEKNYGERYIEPAKKIIEQLTAKYVSFRQLENDYGLNRIKRLAGL